MRPAAPAPAMSDASASSQPGDPVTVLGAGSFGTALAIHLARRGHPTRLWGRNAEAMAELGLARTNARYLAGVPFPKALTVTADLGAAADGAGVVVLGTPSHALSETVAAVLPYLDAERGLVAACKGLEPGRARLVHEVVADVAGADRRLAILSGPTFARELAEGLPTAVTIASSDLEFATRVADAFHGGGFRAYTTDDVIGVEIGGAAKNIIAIGVGIGDGLGLGANTRAGFITRSLNELTRIGVAIGARPETLMGLSGLGDLVLTCTDNQSRNRRFGLALAAGKSVAEAAAEIGQVVEGVKAAPEVLRLAREHGVDAPIVEHVARVIAGELTPAEAVAFLAHRPRRAEIG